MPPTIQEKYAGCILIFDKVPLMRMCRTTITAMIVIASDILCPLYGWAIHPPEEVPTFTQVLVRMTLSLDTVTNLYTYSYTIENTTTQTGAVRYFSVDVAIPREVL